MNKEITLTGKDIDAQEIECNIVFAVYDELEEKDIFLCNMGISEGTPLYNALIKKEVLSVIMNVSVDDEERGNGYGDLLMNKAIKVIDKNNAFCVLCVDEIETQEDGFNLYDFYQKYGFVKNKDAFMIRSEADYTQESTRDFSL
jgi:predicted GNAT family N-acyltransferase